MSCEGVGPLECPISTSAETLTLERTAGGEAVAVFAFLADSSSWPAWRDRLGQTRAGSEQAFILLVPGPTCEVCRDNGLFAVVKQERFTLNSAVDLTSGAACL